MNGAKGFGLRNWRLWLCVGTLLALTLGCEITPPTVAVSAPAVVMSSPPAPTSYEDSPFGMVACVGNRYRDDPSLRDLAISKMAEAGVRWQREEFTWVEIEPQRSEFRWDRYDEAVNRQIAAGINLVGLLDYGAAWWGTPGYDKDMSPLTDAQLGEWSYFVRQVVERYKDHIRYWEIWNEENISTFWSPAPNASDYVRLLRASHEAITSVAPGSQILMGGTSLVDTGFIQQVYDAGGASYFDILAVHPYQGTNPEGDNTAFSAFVDTLTQLSTQFPGKPIWLTEVGWSTADADNWWWVKTGGGSAEQVQASYLVRMYVQALALPQVEKIFWYDFRDDATDSPHENSFGLVRRDSTLQPKPSYLAYQTMTRLLEGATFQRQMRGPKIDSGAGPGDDVYEYRFSKGDEVIVVLWKSRGGSAARLVTVQDVQAASATLTALTGNSQVVGMTNQQVTVNLTEEPLYLTFRPVSVAAVTPPPPSRDSAASATVLVVDVSGSMGEDWRGGVKIDSARSAARSVINMVAQESQVGQSDHQVAIVAFTDDARLELGLTTDYDVAHQTVDRLIPLDRTNLGTGLQVANQALASIPADVQKIIILLSDGLTNEGMSSTQILAGPVQEASQRGTCIYTVGFGDPGDLDEGLLRNIAAGAGCGEYHYASAPADLERVYVRLRHQSLGTVLDEFEGQIAQGETVDVGQVEVLRIHGELYITLHWPGSELDLIVVDPRGRQVDASDPDVSLMAYERLVYLIVQNPIPGAWALQAVGVDVPEGILNYNAIVSVRERTGPPPSNTLAILLSVGLVVLVGAVLVISTIGQQHRPGVAPVGVQVIRGQAANPFAGLRRGKLTIGRDPRCEMVLSDAQVSARHATILQTPQGYVLTDLGSRNGTVVNGQKVQQALLHGGEHLRVGSTELTFGVGATTGPARPFGPMPQPPPGGVAAYLVVVVGGQEFDRCTVVPGTVLGRLAGCPIDLNADALISRQHARLDYQGGQWIIADLGSNNRTLVNGQPVTSQVLRHGDQVRLGNTTMQFLMA